MTRFSNANSNKNELARSRDFVRILFVRLSIRFALDFVPSPSALNSSFFGFWTKVKVKFYFSTFAYMPNEYCIFEHELYVFGGCDAQRRAEKHNQIWMSQLRNARAMHTCVRVFQLFFVAVHLRF